MIRSDQRFENREARINSDFHSVVTHHSIDRRSCSAAWGFLAYGIIWKYISELQDKLDQGEITPDEYRDAWIAEMQKNERLHPSMYSAPDNTPDRKAVIIGSSPTPTKLSIPW
jgi:hypothetical protein